MFNCCRFQRPAPTNGRFWSCSIGTNRVELLGCFTCSIRSQPFSVGLVDLNPLGTRLNWLKTMGIDRYHNRGFLYVASSCLTRLESGAHYPQDYGRVFVEMCSIGTFQPHQPKPVTVETLEQVVLYWEQTHCYCKAISRLCC